MDRKVWAIVIGLVLIAAFFLPYLNVAGFFKISAFDIIGGKEMAGSSRSSGGSPDKYIMLLTPLAGLILVVTAIMNNSVNRLLVGIMAILGMLYPIIRGMIESGGEGFSQVFRFLGIGFWLAIVAAIAVMVYNPKTQSA